MEVQPASPARSVSLHAIVGVTTLVAVIALLLVAFYEPFPTITILNAADHPIEDVQLETLGSETQGETHELGTIQVGQTEQVTVRSYEVTVLGLSFDLQGERIEYEDDPLPLEPGQARQLTVGRDGEVTGVYELY